MTAGIGTGPFSTRTELGSSPELLCAKSALSPVGWDFLQPRIQLPDGQSVATDQSFGAKGRSRFTYAHLCAWTRLRRLIPRLVVWEEVRLSVPEDAASKCPGLPTGPTRIPQQAQGKTVLGVSSVLQLYCLLSQVPT